MFAVAHFSHCKWVVDQAFVELSKVKSVIFTDRLQLLFSLFSRQLSTTRHIWLFHHHDFLSGVDGNILTMHSSFPLGKAYILRREVSQMPDWHFQHVELPCGHSRQKVSIDLIITLETAYKVAICPRGNLPYKQIYLTKDLKLLKNGAFGHWNTYFISDFTLLKVTL